ncbi:hypothetical protein [Pedobacter agri]|uniref:hypothetical protein n=1 Tax=Pedobacter agri TaxID=454586 RepID=UPI00292E03D0|nr:hypothetical protein [Pedobacter agri]
MGINQRIRAIVDVKCGGNQRSFASKLEYTPQYVAKLVKDGGSVGLEPISKILQVFSDIDARWLILGDREMIEPGVINEVKYFLHQNIQDMLKIEQYLPFMTDDELKEYRNAAAKFTAYNYNDQQLKRWVTLSEKNGR